jgi:hypothetical protein
VQDGHCGGCGFTVGGGLPPSKLGSVPLDMFGDNLVQMLQRMGIPQPAIFVTVVDLDTGELISTGNLSAPDTLELLRFVVKQHEDGAFDEAPPSVLQ